ncbi:MAG: hypothetical protein J3Q66DRAFT_322758 [Benniella sp.]|nr:MAG: hypothetical protein J3Q66DRAFT_322758 [Benniella sp.]
MGLVVLIAVTIVAVTGVPVTSTVLGLLTIVLQVFSCVAKHLAKEVLERLRIVLGVLVVATVVLVVILAMTIVLVVPIAIVVVVVVVFGRRRFVRGKEPTAYVLLLCSC